MNKVYFTVGNPTGDPVASVHFPFILPRTDLRVFTSPPSVDRLPPLPQWPQRFRDRALGAAISAGAQDYDIFAPHAGSVSSSSKEFEVTWQVGDLRPGEWSRPLEITLVPGPNAPD